MPRSREEGGSLAVTALSFVDLPAKMPPLVHSKPLRASAFHSVPKMASI